MSKLILKNDWSPGDIVMLTAAVRDLHRCYPGEFLTDVRTTCSELWDNNPYLTRLGEQDPDVTVLHCDYPLVHHSNEAPYHCLHGFVDYLNNALGLRIRVTEFKGDIHLSDLERAELSEVQRLTGEDLPFWIVVAGGKFDATVKWWETERFQGVVDHFRGRIAFVQVGEKGHYHPALSGVIDLRGKTDLRQLVRLVHHSQGVLCGITALMHLAAAVETKAGSPPKRPCVVIGGGREPAHWVEYPQHQFISTVGQLPCCLHGGCWKSRTVPLDDGDKRDDPEWLCRDVVGRLPRCMHMISPAEVIRRIEAYFAGGLIHYLTGDQAQAAAQAVAVTSENSFVSGRPSRKTRLRSRAVILQQASGIHTQMLDLSYQRHSAYAARNGFAFWAVRGDVQSERHPCWNKIVLIHMALAAGFEFVVWLDADTLIVRVDADFRDGLRQGPPLGMCLHPGGWGDPPRHYNSGVILIRNTPETCEFFDNVWQAGPVDHAWHEQVRINECILLNPSIVQTIDNTWNCLQEINPSAEPVVRAWHGYGADGITCMRQLLADLESASVQLNGSYNTCESTRFLPAAHP